MWGNLALPWRRNGWKIKLNAKRKETYRYMLTLCGCLCCIELLLQVPVKLMFMHTNFAFAWYNLVKAHGKRGLHCIWCEIWIVVLQHCTSWVVWDMVRIYDCAFVNIELLHNNKYIRWWAHNVLSNPWLHHLNNFVRGYTQPTYSIQPSTITSIQCYTML